MEHKIGRSLLSFSVIAAAVALAVIGLAVIGSSSSDALNTGDTFESDTIEGVTLTYYVYSSTQVFVGDGEGSIDIGDADTLTIPSTVTHESITYSVTKINNMAFYYCSSLETVTIPSNVQIIGTSAFEGTAISTINMAEGLTTIGQYAFCGIELEELILPNSVTSIHEGAFSYCPNLGTVRFGTSITSSGLNAGMFMGSPVTTITVDSGNTALKAINNIVLSMNGTWLFLFPSGETGTYTVPAGITTIASSAFYGCSITGIVLPSGVRTVGDNAFRKCYDLTSLTINCADVDIGEYAFYETGLTSVQIGNGVSDIDDYAFGCCLSLETVSIDATGTIGYYVFSDCDSLTSVTIGPHVSGLISGDTFLGCTSVTSLSVDSGNTIYTLQNNALYCNVRYHFQPYRVLTYYPAGVAATSFTVSSGADWILPYAFAYSKITSVSTSNVTQIGEGAFLGCNDLATITLGSSMRTIGDHAFEDCVSITSITIPNTVTTIGDYAFSGCTSLESISSANVTQLGYGVFFRCFSLETVSFTNRSLTIAHNSAEKGLFEMCTSLSSVALPSSLDTLYTYMFYGCSSLTYLDVSNIEEIEAWALSGTGFTSITLPSGLDTIGDYAFYRCSSLASISIPNNVTSIGADAFYGCSSLTTVTIGTKVRTIGAHAFRGCSSLSTLNYNAKRCDDLSDGSGAFVNTGQFSVVFGNSVERIPANLFNSDDYNYSRVTSITIGSGVESIGTNAFAHCSDLGFVTVDAINDDYASVGGVLFNKTFSTLILYPSSKNGTEYTIPNGVTLLANGAFYECIDLEKLIIPSTVTATEGKAVDGCTNLTFISIPNSITTLAVTEFNGMVFYDSDRTTVMSYTDVIGHTFVGNDGTSLIKQTFITFDSTGGSDVNPIMGVSGDPVSAPEAPTRKGYTFTKWQLNGIDYTFSVIPNQNITLTAVWAANQYDVTLDCNGGLSDGTVKATYDSKLPAFTALTRTGYTLKGYYTVTVSGILIIDDKGVLVPSVEGISDANGNWICDSAMTFFAQWEANTYTVTFHGNGSTDGSMTVQNFTYDIDQNLNANAYSRTGYSCTGWSTTSTGDKAYDDQQSVRNLTAVNGGNVDLYVHWTINQYSVSFNSNGGSITNMITQDYGTAITAPENPTRRGYLFAGWEPAIPSVMPANNTLCVAQWVAKEYSVTFNSNGGVVSTPESKTVTFDDRYGGFASTSKQGYVFVGWFTFLSGGSQVTSDTVCRNATDHTLYARWTPIRYTVTFDGNGHTSGSMAVENFTYNVEKELSANKYSRTGYSFSGWSTTSTGEKEFEDQEDVSNLTDVDGDNVTLYAVWNINQYTVKFINEDNIFSKYYADYGSTIVLPQDTPVKSPTTETAYTFSSWGGYSAGMTVPAREVLFKALYTSSPREYNAVFMNEGKVHEVITVGYGSTIPVPSTDPVKPADSNFRYEFTYWDGYYDGIIMSSDISFDAVYISVANKVVVTENKAVVASGTDDVVKIGSKELTDIKSKVESGELDAFEIKLNEGTIALDVGAVKSISGDTVVASLFQIKDHSILPEELISKVEGRTVYSVNLGDNHNFNGKLTITVAYTLKDGEDPNDLRICYYTSDGKIETYPCTYKDGMITFTTDHLSYYAVTVEKDTSESGIPTWVIVILAAGVLIAACSALVVLKKKGIV